MADWIYYVTTMKFQDIKDWIKKTEEVHSNKKLSDLIQRSLDGKRTDSIKNYLLSQEKERFFNAIVVGIYQGEPQWASLNISSPENADFEITEDQEIDMERTIGLLKLSGDEKLFAIDGQHRVAGIKKALSEDESLIDEEITVIFVAHDEEERSRTRRLFTTLNSQAKKVDEVDIVALHEDNGFAIVTRKLVDEFNLLSLSDRVDFRASPALPKTDRKHLTTVIGLYYLVQDSYPVSPPYNYLKKAEFKDTRPSDILINKVYEENCLYWNLLVEFIPEYQNIFSNPEADVSQYRSNDSMHLLFLSAGQRSFTSAVQVLVSRGLSLKESVKILSKTNLWIHSQEWHHILWNPLQQRVIAANRTSAETFLLKQVGQEGRTKRNDQRLKELIKNRDGQLSI
ncbi:MAG: DGQHR domain-containing protein [Pseudanabaena sp. M007S1SP1A06QC]|nr:DGQHR domain-containing protein [Pseudanabaena sp. M007S1SP1A06QC]